MHAKFTEFVGLLVSITFTGGFDFIYGRIHWNGKTIQNE